MKSFSHNDALEAVPDSPVFEGLGLDGLCHCLNCMSGRVLVFDREEEICPDGECNLLCAVVEGSAAVAWRDSGEEVNVLEKGRVFSFDKGHSMIYVLKAAPGLKLLVFDGARAAIPCGNNCEYHLLLMRNIVAMMMRRDFDPVK